MLRSLKRKLCESSFGLPFLIVNNLGPQLQVANSITPRNDSTSVVGTEPLAVASGLPFWEFLTRLLPQAVLYRGLLPRFLLAAFCFLPTAFCLFRPQVWKKNHIPNRMLVREQHYQPIDANADSGRRRHAVRQCANIIFVHHHRLFITTLALNDLIFEALILLFGIVEFRKAIGGFERADEVFEPLRDGRISGRSLRQRRDRFGEVCDEGWLNQMRFSYLLKNCRDRNCVVCPGLVLGDVLFAELLIRIVQPQLQARY